MLLELNTLQLLQSQSAHVVALAFTSRLLHRNNLWTNQKNLGIRNSGFRLHNSDFRIQVSEFGIENSEIVKQWGKELLPDSLTQQFFDPM